MSKHTLAHSERSLSELVNELEKAIEAYASCIWQPNDVVIKGREVVRDFRTALDMERARAALPTILSIMEDKQ